LVPGRGREPTAKFRIAATLATQIEPAASSEDALWAELERLTPIFLGRWQAIRAGAPLPDVADGPSLLEVCRELAYRMLTHCNFCPWNCRVDRMAGATTVRRRTPCLSLPCRGRRVPRRCDENAS
jgi:uncharacterized Fe-S radical SAM superfamily protein PflX